MLQALSQDLPRSLFFFLSFFCLVNNGVTREVKPASTSLRGEGRGVTVLEKG